MDPDWAALETRFHPTQFASKRDYEYCQNILNRETYGTEADYPMVRCMDAGLDFLRRNSDAGDWFLQIETFDPHEPFCAPERFMQGRSTGYDGPTLDWPPYGRDEFSAAERDHLRATYEAKLAFCDEQLGRVLDMFDTQGLWEDTMLIVTTDHGYLLGEHQWWAKNRMPCYEEICHIPLFLHHPAEAGRAGTRCDALTQTVDLAPTVLAAHGLAPSPDMIGQDQRSAMAGKDRREAVIFGSFGGAVNVTDGNHVLMRYPPDMDAANLWQYTVMPTTVGGAFSVAEMAGAEMAPPFRFTKGMPLMRVPLGEGNPYYYNQGPAVLQDTETVMYDLQLDPQQQAPAQNKDVAARLDRKMLQIMRELDAPQEMIERIGLGRQQLEAAVS